MSSLNFRNDVLLRKNPLNHFFHAESFNAAVKSDDSSI